jgi:hypothetical protein
VADAQGLATIHLEEFPASGALLGRVDDPNSKGIALFTLEKSESAPGTVQLFDAGTVEGRTVNARGRAVAGISVGAFFPGESAADAILLWQAFSGKDGAFRWNAVVPGVPQRLAARAGAESSGESATFNLAPAEVKSLGDIAVEGAKDGSTRRGNALKWHQWPVLCGTLPAAEVCAKSPAMLLYVNGASIPALMESLSRVRTLLNMPDLVIALISDTAPDCGESTVPVLSGKPEGGATTLLVDRQGQVVLETSGLPPVSVIQSLQP